MRHTFISLLLTFFAFGLSPDLSLAQEKSQAPDTYLQKHLADQGYLNNDYFISSSHQAGHNGVTYTYIQQVYEGLEVHDATGVVLTRGSKVLHSDVATMRKDIEINSEKPGSVLPPDLAMRRIAEQLEYPLTKLIPTVKKIDNISFALTNLPYAKGAVIFTEIWIEDNQGRLAKHWQVDLHSNINADHLSLIVNRSSGQIIKKLNHTVYCKFHDTPPGSILKNYVHPKKQKIESPLPPIVGGGSYKVFAPPVESPSHGPQTVVEDPANAKSSPFGWHDTDGRQGAEYTITRGNNVHAYEDIQNEDQSQGNEPDGGENLSFEYDYNLAGSVLENIEADVTNLFFWNNYMHDWTYQFGFNEGAGNFQFNNYRQGGAASDHVIAETLDGAGVGNATFSGPKDGENGAMQMHRWIVGSQFSVLSPASLIDDYNIGLANFGPARGATISGNLVIASDAVGVTGDVCQAITNGEEIDGNVALIDRGTCDFSFKVHAAQNEGAIACIICNNVDNGGTVSMGAGENAELVNIPAVFLSKEDCQRIKNQMSNGVNVQVSIVESTEISSSFDNGIVAHEYVHGVSLRLVGGRNNSNCLGNDEQVGEGWSDFFALVATQQDDDIPTQARAVGTFALSESVTGNGIRRYPYSTDMTINPQIHSHIRASQTPHPLGEIWAVALWDMYWVLIEAYGYDASWTDETSGNFIAMQLVIDAMKIQGCGAGILKARNALLTADRINNQGSNECLIWQAMARRGLGFDAVGGNSDWRYDNVDGFALPPSCKNGIEITRNVTPVINVGDQIRVDIVIDNYDNLMENLTLTDIVPKLENQDVSFGEILTDDIVVDVDGSNVNFTIGQLQASSSLTVSYTLNSNNIVAPDFDVFDNFEGQHNFNFSKTDSEMSGWSISDSMSLGGKFSLAKNGGQNDGDAFATFQSVIPISTVDKVVKFDHRFEAQLGFDGGIIEVSSNNGRTWEALGEEQILVNAYRDQITYNSLYTNVEGAFTGLDTSWKTSILDLSDYENEKILLRFKYVEQQFIEEFMEETEGWHIDNFEVFDRQEIIGSACLNSGDEELACDVSSTFVNSNARITSSQEIFAAESDFIIAPNPAQEQIIISLKNKIGKDVTIAVYNSDGKLIGRYERSLHAGLNSWNYNISHLTPGFYVIELQTPDGAINQKFIKQ